MGVCALVFGILACALFWVPILKWVLLVLAFVGVILGAVGLKNKDKKGIAIAGLILSIVGLALSIYGVVACNALGAAGAIGSML